MDAPSYDPTPELIHRDSGLWTRVLAASGAVNPLSGAPFTEAMLAGLGGGIGFMVFTFAYKEVTTASVVTRFHPGPFVANMLDRSGAGVEVQQTTSARLARGRLDSVLDAGRPTVVRVVPAALPWRKRTLLTESGSTDVVVVSRDGEGYLVDDGGGRLERIGAGELAAARAQSKADKHWQAHVGAPPGAPLTPGVVAEAVRETARALLSGEAPAGIPAGYGKNFGIRGMETWRSRLLGTRTKGGWPVLFADPQRRRAGLDMLVALLTGPEFSGPGALRPLYAAFLREAADPAWVQAAELYDGLGSRWDGFAAAVGRQQDADFTAMAELLDGIIEEERRAATALLG
ncbi:BtrH N-terminal domain-containing protein [Arthrobacter sp. 35W]|uniref:BtrH N-terminal domain-containing protein n=1 Tax=Arthrobacter sp. 35W TaxID=1132441 RepID=UPI0003FFF8A2|nr:BtrH N-terminal domain-containing protein [Arthrobacter sp. 35W]